MFVRDGRFTVASRPQAQRHRRTGAKGVDRDTLGWRAAGGEKEVQVADERVWGMFLCVRMCVVVWCAVCVRVSLLPAERDDQWESRGPGEGCVDWIVVSDQARI